MTQRTAYESGEARDDRFAALVRTPRRPGPGVDRGPAGLRCCVLLRRLAQVGSMRDLFELRHRLQEP